eukprot:Sro731_g194301.2  (208) ;mRNA; f:35314-36058
MQGNKLLHIRYVVTWSLHTALFVTLELDVEMRTMWSDVFARRPRGHSVAVPAKTTFARIAGEFFFVPCVRLRFVAVAGNILFVIVVPATIVFPMEIPLRGSILGMGTNWMSTGMRNIHTACATVSTSWLQSCVRRVASKLVFVEFAPLVDSGSVVWPVIVVLNSAAARVCHDIHHKPTPREKAIRRHSYSSSRPSWVPRRVQRSSSL